MGIKTPPEFKQMEYRWLLVELAKLFKPYTYVEIGVKKCYTFNAMCEHVSRPVAVDILDPRDYITWNHAEVHVCDSKEFALAWRDPIDFLFIDGDHNADSVIGDFESLFKFVREDTGLIFLHDTYPVIPELTQPGYCSDAWKAARYLRERANGTHPDGLLYEIVTLPGPWAGISVIRPLKRGKKSPDSIGHGWMDADVRGVEE